MEFKIQKNKIPNILTVARIIITFLIIIIFLLPQQLFYTLNNPFNPSQSYSFISWNLFFAGILFVIACVTDYIDGYLARKYNWVSTFGKFWDPIADKILINTVLIFFAVGGLIPVWITVLMIIRDVIVDAFRMNAASKNIVVAANKWGKMKTVAQMIGIIFIFFLFAGHPYGDTTSNLFYWLIQNLMMYIALGLSLYSGFIYVYQINKQLKHANNTRDN